MFDQLFEDICKASESSLQMQQEMFKHWTERWFLGPLNGVEGSAEWRRTFQKRWSEFTIEMLNKHRESIESTYRTGIQLIEQAFRASEAKSPEDYRRTAEDLWRQLLQTFRNQSEAQLRHFEKWAEKSFEMSQKANFS